MLRKTLFCHQEMEKGGDMSHLDGGGIDLPRDVKAVKLGGCMGHVPFMVGALNSEGM